MARLEALESPELIPGAIADAVGPAQVPGVELWEEVLDHLRDRRALVLLDNCEHLLKASASYASRLLDHCPLVGVVATSREPMGLRREWVVRVSPLDVREKAEASAAVELFRQRAERGGRVAGGALATRVVADLCDRLDGLPLAIELAAARAHVLSPEEIVRALDERAGILQSTDPDVPGRQRSLEDMLDWSYELLTDDEQLVLRRLAVFASSFSLVTAQKACAAGTDFDVAEVVWSLTTKSLVDTRPRSIAAVRQFTWSASYNYLTDGTGRLETRQATGSFFTEFENSDGVFMGYTRRYEFVERSFGIARGVTIPVGGYSFQNVFLGYRLRPQRKISGVLQYERGSFFGGERSAVNYFIGRVEITPQISLEPSVSFNWIDLPQGTFTTQVVRTRAIYTLTPRMYFTALMQYNSSSDSLSSNLRLRWEYQPGSELFVVYSEGRDTEVPGFPGLENRAFVVKFNRLFRF